MPTFDEEIARAIQESLDSGELKSAKNWGKPFEFSPDEDNSPADKRLAFKILKNSGFTPPEVGDLGTLEVAKKELAALSPDAPNYSELQRKVSDLKLKIAVRLEGLRSTKDF